MIMMIIIFLSRFNTNQLTRFNTNQFNDLLPIVLLAQLVERCTGIAEIKGSNPVQAWIFSDFLFATTKVASVLHCDDHISSKSSPCSSHIWFSYIHNSHHHHFSVCNEPIQRPAPSWLVGWIGKSAAPVSQRSRVRIPCKPEFFSGFLFATAQVASVTAMIIFHLIS